MNQNICIIVLGALNTDIIATGIPKFISPGEQTTAKKLQICPGGKARNIAQMTAILTGPNKVAMIGKTVKDPFNLWKPPYEALQEAGVDVKFIKILSFEDSGKFPGIALIKVDAQGRNKIYVIPGINENLEEKDLEHALSLFQEAEQNKGFVILTFEMSSAVLLQALSLAKKHNLKVLIDPGAYNPEVNYNPILEKSIFLIKPNEHEAKFLTGVDVVDFNSAAKAAVILLKKGIENVLITVGEKGAYFFNSTQSVHLPAPKIISDGQQNSVGCGDQTMAGIAYFLHNGESILDACTLGILAGTLQFNKEGVDPIRKEEMGRYSYLLK